MEVRVFPNYKEFAFLLKAKKNNHSSASDWWEYVKSCFKESARTFSKNSTTQENITVEKKKVEKNYEADTIKEISNQKLNQ